MRYRFHNAKPACLYPEIYRGRYFYKSKPLNPPKANNSNRALLVRQIRGLFRAFYSRVLYLFFFSLLHLGFVRAVVRKNTINVCHLLPTTQPGHTRVVSRIFADPRAQFFIFKFTRNPPRGYMMKQTMTWVTRRSWLRLLSAAPWLRVDPTSNSVRVYYSGWKHFFDPPFVFLTCSLSFLHVEWDR